MYYPYLRGRQYELIALREMIEHGLLAQCIVPIIEPVKASPTLLSTIQMFVESKSKVVVIQNPLAGSFMAAISRDENYKEKYETLIKSEYIIPAFIAEPRTAHLLEPLNCALLSTHIFQQFKVYHAACSARSTIWND